MRLAARGRVEVRAPHLAQQRGRGDHPRRLDREDAQHLVLGGGQRDRLAVDGDAAATIVDREPADANGSAGARAVSTIGEFRHLLHEFDAVRARSTRSGSTSRGRSARTNSATRSGSTVCATA